MWIQPKTDWQSGDFFNVEDYNRIKGNLNELKSLAQRLWFNLNFGEYEEMGEDKTYQDISFYADEINRFEDNLDIICSLTYGFSIGEKQTFEPNTPFIRSAELNRIESAALRIYENLKNQYEGRRMLTFALGIRGGEM